MNFVILFVASNGSRKEEGRKEGRCFDMEEGWKMFLKEQKERIQIVEI